MVRNEAFPLQSGARQGCPLLSLLFNTDLEVLATAIREDIKKRWQEYTEELYKNDLNGLDNHDGVITHLEPDILE